MQVLNLKQIFLKGDFFTNVSGLHRKGKKEEGFANTRLGMLFFCLKVNIYHMAFLQEVIGQRRGLSDGDARQANLLYKCAGNNYIKQSLLVETMCLEVFCGCVKTRYISLSLTPPYKI